MDRAVFPGKWFKELKTHQSETDNQFYRVKNCVRRSFHSSTEQPAPVCPRSHQDWNPPEGIRMSDAFPSRTAFLLFLFFYFLSPPPKQLLSSERSLVMKRQHIETTLTLIWRHDSALLEDFSVFWTTFFSHLCRQSALTSVFWLTLFPFPRLTVCLCTVRRLCKHIEPLPLCALHLIFIWSMKADGMPSSQTPCVKPVVSLLKICSVGRPDLTESHSKPEMQIVDTPLLASLSVCFLFFIIIILIQKRKEALKQAAFNMSRRSNIYPCRIQLRFSPFFSFLALVHPKPWNCFYPCFITMFPIS